MFDVPPPVQLRGIEAYRESWEQMFRWLAESGTFEVTELEVTAGHDVAFCLGMIRCRGAGELEELAVRLTIGLRKVGGEWLVFHEHHSEPSS